MRTRQPLWATPVEATGAAFVVSAIACAACVLASCTPASPLEGPTGVRLVELSGAATVTDGDTIRVSGTRVRLDGIDAPEGGKRCGDVDVYVRASDALRALIAGQNVVCAITGQPDRYGRTIGRCRANGVDLNSRMVELGMARDWPRYSHGDYANAERAARAQHRGIWGLQCPADLWGNRNYD